MKIAILGTRGIPNNYGGFEQLAEFLSLGLQARGHEVYVYSSHLHTYQKNEWQGVNIIHCYDPEKKIGTIGQFIYDFNCIIDSRKRNFDTILNLGYTSSSIWKNFFPKKARLVTNMDGLEWKRTKYSSKVRKFLKYAEKLAVKMSDDLVADSRAIQDYLKEKYTVSSHFIAYGAGLFDAPDQKVLEQYKVEPHRYSMLIARMEPENNIEVILEGVHRSHSKDKFYVVGNFANTFGTYLATKYKGDQRIVFLGPIYDLQTVNNLRYFSTLYFHGHSVGGTNPSLIEAMGSHSLIAAHDNPFNRSVLNDDAFYFSSSSEVSSLLNKTINKAAYKNTYVRANYEKIKNDYSWEKIVSEYEKILIIA